MPHSAQEGKSWAVEVIKTLPVQEALDVGPGSGTYAQLFPHISMDAVEVWEPYVKEFNLKKIYRRVWTTDFLKFETDERWSLVILGDVIEHFNKADAYMCWEKARTLAGQSGFVLCSTPILPWPQGHEHGNPYEEHKFQFNWDELRSLDGVINSFRQDPIGVVLANGK